LATASFGLQAQDAAKATPKEPTVEERLGDFDFVEGHSFEHTGLGGGEIGIYRNRHQILLGVGYD
jgi:hypothetical protein